MQVDAVYAEGVEGNPTRGPRPKTVRNHVSNVLTTRAVPDRSAAIVRAREGGLRWPRPRLTPGPSTRPNRPRGSREVRSTSPAQGFLARSGSSTALNGDDILSQQDAPDFSRGERAPGGEPGVEDLA
jgi:hypothetical protein